jgi:hypothetical protein
MDGAGTAGEEAPAGQRGAEPPADPTDPTPRPLRLSGVEAVKAHLTLVVGLALCIVAFWFELGRALGGNGLSWAYVFEWPLFAAFAVYMWWSVLHGGRAVRPRARSKTVPAVDPKYTGMLEAWTTHQRELQAAQGVQDAHALRADAERRQPTGHGSTDDADGRAPG